MVGASPKEHLDGVGAAVIRREDEQRVAGTIREIHRDASIDHLGQRLGLPRTGEVDNAEEILELGGIERRLVLVDAHRRSADPRARGQLTEGIANAITSSARFWTR
jgi:hypothetical protein